MVNLMQFMFIMFIWNGVCDNLCHKQCLGSLSGTAIPLFCHCYKLLLDTGKSVVKFEVSDFLLYIQGESFSLDFHKDPMTHPSTPPDSFCHIPCYSGRPRPPLFTQGKQLPLIIILCELKNRGSLSTDSCLSKSSMLFQELTFWRRNALKAKA